MSRKSFACPECSSPDIRLAAPGKNTDLNCNECGAVFPLPEMTAKKRVAAAGTRHRREKGEVEVKEAPELTVHDLGTITANTQAILGDGPDALVAAHREASRLSRKFGEDFEAEWMLMTPWLHELKKTHGARVRYALKWRPRFLATMALSRSIVMASRVCRIGINTARRHRANDPDFATQWDAAEEYATQLLHDACFASALEGDCEPVFWQGLRVGHIKKFDSRLRIEMLRAHLPTRFKTPGGNNVVLNTGDTNILVLDRPTQGVIHDARRQALLRMKSARARGASDSDVLEAGVPVVTLPDAIANLVGPTT